jgi:hypothetical protein
MSMLDTWICQTCGAYCFRLSNSCWRCKKPRNGQPCIKDLEEENQ